MRNNLIEKYVLPMPSAKPLETGCRLSLPSCSSLFPVGIPGVRPVGGRRGAQSQREHHSTYHDDSGVWWQCSEVDQFDDIIDNLDSSGGLF